MIILLRDLSTVNWNIEFLFLQNYVFCIFVDEILYTLTMVYSLNHDFNYEFILCEKNKRMNFMILLQFK